MYKLTNSTRIVRIADGISIPADSANVDYVEYLAWCSEGNTPESADPIPSPVAHVKMAQARKALLRKGLLALVDETINAIQDPILRQEAKIEWEFEPLVWRDSHLVYGLAGGLGLTDTALDELFEYAKTL